MMENAVINQDEFAEAIDSVLTEKIACKVSHLAKGLWHVVKARIYSANRLTLQLELSDHNQNAGFKIDVDQPIGISFQYKFNKYMFETTVVGFEPVNELGHCRRFMVNRPAACERVHRRAYERVPVPEDMHIDLLFWHRGYTDGQSGVPMENYWQSSLLDLSAGGMLAEIDKSHEKDFRRGQLVGLQFTPLPYEKPLLLEGQIKHIAFDSKSDKLQLGIKFVGLEASSDGREKLTRITKTVTTYSNHSNTAKEKIEQN